MAYPAPKREPVPGQELLKQRVRVSFEFDVVCNDGPVRNLSYDEGGTIDMALLKSFLTADKGKLLDLMVDNIGQKLGMHSCETFIHEFLPQVSTECHELFRPAIEALEGEDRTSWDEICKEPDTQWGDYLSLCTEEIVECFKAEFVSSSYETIYEQDFTGDRTNIPTWQEMVGILKDDVASKDAS